MFYRRWIAACAAGELLGIGTATAAALVFSAGVGEPDSTLVRLWALALFAAVGAVEGGALAWLQWRVLRVRLPRLRAGEWAGPTVAVAVAGWIVGMTPSLFFAPAAPSAPAPEPHLAGILAVAAASGAIAGVIFGLAQWFVLRRHAERAGRWVWIHAPAWALAMAAIFLGASVPDADWPPWGIAVSGAAGGVLGGLLLGAVTGLVARRLAPWLDEQGWSMRGKACAVTGANAGIGEEVALGLARLGASVALLCRRPSEGERTRRRILAMLPEADVSVVSCDLADFGSIRRAAGILLGAWPRLDVLVHNAGATFPTRTLTADGVEATLAVDVVGPFLLTSLLRPKIEASGGRVVALTGIYHRKGRIDTNDLHFATRPYDWLSANNQAQRMRFLCVWELARRAPRLFAAAVHPGAVLTGAQARLPRLARLVVRTVLRPAFVRPEIGAIPVLRLAARPGVDEASGQFFDRCRATDDRPDPALAAECWRACEALTASGATPPVRKSA